MDQYIGTIQTFGFGFPPAGWMHCNGDLLPISQYDALFALIGTTYGGDGVTTFGLPDLRGRVMIHQGQGPGLLNVTMGQMGGAESITVLANNMPAHNHGVTVGVNTATGEDPEPTKVIAAKQLAFAEEASGSSKLGGVVESPVGGGAPIAIRNPYVGIYHAIAVEGIFPNRN